MAYSRESLVSIMDGELSSFMTEEGRKSMVDERTIFGTPQPLAASTVQRPDKTQQKPTEGHHLMDSFVNITSASSPAPRVEDLPLIKFSFSDLENSNRNSRAVSKSRPSTRFSPSNEANIAEQLSPPLANLSSRSSMGILQIDSMQDLSASLIELDPSPDRTDVQISNTVKANKKFKVANNTDKTVARNFPGTNITAKLIDLSSDSLGTVQHVPDLVSNGVVRKQRTGTSHMAISHISSGKKDEVRQKNNVLGFAFGSTDDPDASVHEVKLDEDELGKIDEDFSDFEDLEDTMIGEKCQGDFFHQNSIHNDQAQYSELKRRSNAHKTRSKSPNVEVGDNNFSSQHSLRDVNIRRTNRDCQGHFRGEGQESDRTMARSYMSRKGDNINLNPTFFQENPMTHNLGDGKEEENRGGVSTSQRSIAFADRPPSYPGVRGQGAGIEDSSEEIDTDDEVDAVKRENSRRSQFTSDRERIVGSSAERRDGITNRPGLEGGSSEDNEAVLGQPHNLIGPRLRAEGEIVPVQTGDGGQGGDGSSGGSSDDDNMSVDSLSSSASSRQGQTTLDVLRTMGFVGNSNFVRPAQFQEDDPEAQTRIRPMGDDLLEMHTTAESGHVRFASNVDYRSRTLSGASFENDRSRTTDESSDEHDDDLGTDSRLDSQFLAATNYNSQSSAASMANNTLQSSLWAQDQSSFHLEDVFPGMQAGVTSNEGQFRSTEQSPHQGDDVDRTLTPENMLENSWAYHGSPGFTDGLKEPSDERQLFRDFDLGTSPRGSSVTSEANETGNVYQNKVGEYVTDLAFKSAFGEEADNCVNNPFDSNGVEFAENFEDDEQFLSGDQGLVMLEEDQKEFEKENLVVQENSRQDMTSWSFHSQQEIKAPWLSDSQNDSDSSKHMRISIGTFMQTRTGALGSLGDDDKAPRPTFGSKIITPPSNRKPVALIDITSPRLSDINEDATCKQEDQQRADARKESQSSTVNKSKHGYKSSDAESVKDATFIMDDLYDSPVFASEYQRKEIDKLFAKIEEDEVLSSQNEDIYPGTSENENKEERNTETPVQQISGGERTLLDSQTNTPFADKTGYANVSAISRLVTSAALSAKPQELAELIMQMSNDQAAQKRAPQQQQIEEANQKEEEKSKTNKRSENKLSDELKTQQVTFVEEETAGQFTVVKDKFVDSTNNADRRNKVFSRPSLHRNEGSDNKCKQASERSHVRQQACKDVKRKEQESVLEHKSKIPVKHSKKTASKTSQQTPARIPVPKSHKQESCKPAIDDVISDFYENNNVLEQKNVEKYTSDSDSLYKETKYSKSKHLEPTLLDKDFGQKNKKMNYGSKHQQVDDIVLNNNRELLAELEISSGEGVQVDTTSGKTIDSLKDSRLVSHNKGKTPSQNKLFQKQSLTRDELRGADVTSDINVNASERIDVAKDDNDIGRKPSLEDKYEDIYFHNQDPRYELKSPTNVKRQIFENGNDYIERDYYYEKLIETQKHSEDDYQRTHQVSEKQKQSEAKYQQSYQAPDARKRSQPETQKQCEDEYLRTHQVPEVLRQTEDERQMSCHAPAQVNRKNNASNKTHTQSGKGTISVPTTGVHSMGSQKDFEKVHRFDVSETNHTLNESDAASFVLPSKHAEYLARFQTEVESESSSEDSVIDHVEKFNRPARDRSSLIKGRSDLSPLQQTVKKGSWVSPRPSSVTSRSMKDDVESCSMYHPDRRSISPKSSKCSSKSLAEQISKPGSPSKQSISPRIRLSRSKSPSSRISIVEEIQQSRSPKKSRSPRTRLSRSKSPAGKTSTSPRSPRTKTPFNKTRSPRASKHSSIGIVSPSPQAVRMSRTEFSSTQTVRDSMESAYYSDQQGRSSLNNVGRRLGFGDAVSAGYSAPPSDRFGYTPTEEIQSYFAPRSPSIEAFSSQSATFPAQNIHSNQVHNYPQETRVVNSGVMPNMYPYTPGVGVYPNVPAVAPSVGGYVQHHSNVYMPSYGTWPTMPPVVPFSASTVLGDRVPSRMGVPFLPSSVIPASPRATIVSPPELRFSEVCCIGLSTQTTLKIQNPTHRWVQCSLRISSLRIDSSDQNLFGIESFKLKEKTIVEPNSTEELKVMFMPKQPGVYIAQLEISPSPVVSDLPLEPDRVPCIVNIQAVAEKPNIQIITEGDRLVDFGEMPWGCNKVMPITLVNRGLAKVPIRLTISANKSSWHCFTFDPVNSNTSNTSIVSNTARPIISTLARSIVNLVLEGNKESTESLVKTGQVGVHFQAPQRYDKGSLFAAPEEHSARIDIEVDSPSPDASICCLTMKAIVGSARLHIPRSLEKITLKTDIGEPITTLLPIRNSGNIPLQISLCVTEFDEHFTLLPSHVKIEPNQDAEVVVKFTPKCKEKMEYLSQLILFIEPNGRAYELELEGHILEREQMSPSQQKIVQAMLTPGPTLLSNKHFLAWGGVPLGQAKQQKVILCNNSKHLMKLSLRIRGSATEFQLQSFSEGTKILAAQREIILKPLEEFSVHVLFAPTKVGAFTGKLQIKPALDNQKYSIPLSGYGGCSKIIIENLKTGQGNYWANVGQVIVGRNTITKIIVKNNGSRPAFVKALCFTDLRVKYKLASSRVSVQPGEFVLHNSETQTVVIVFSPTEKEASLCSDRPYVIGTVGFYYGDEISRQRYRRSIYRDGKKDCPAAGAEPLSSVNFNISYQGEESISEDQFLPDTQCDQDLFYASIKMVKLAIVGDPAMSYGNTMQPIAFDDSVATIMDVTADSNALTRERNVSGAGALVNRVNNLAQTPPEKGTPAVQRRRVGSQSSFTVIPEHIILTSSRTGGESSIKYMQLVNTCDRGLKYEMSWPAHYIRITPEQGILEPRSTLSLCISPSGSVFSRGIELPWSGQIHITCDGETKVIKVQIREDLLMDESLYPSRDKHPLANQPVTPLVAMTTSKLESGPGELKITSQDLKFPLTEVGKVSETCLHLTNVTQDPVCWMVSSFAPVYVKDGDNTSEVFRATYSAFNFAKKVGTIEPNEEVQIPVAFIPREKGLYSQCWEVETQSRAMVAASTHTIKVQLVGEGIRKGVSDEADKGVLVRTSSSLSAARRRKMDLDSSLDKNQEQQLVIDDKLYFPSTVVGQNSVSKLIVKNNSSSRHRLEVIHPQPPFYSKAITKFSISKRHYVRLPIEYRPRIPGEQKGLLLIKTEFGATHSVQLCGQASEQTTT